MQPLLPIQNHLALMYIKVQESPMASNVMVPVVAPDFQPAFETVITMSPESAYIANTLICPVAPVAKVAVSAADVEK